MAKDSFPETYVQWARRQPRHCLDASERRMLEKGEQWDQENPVLAAGLDRLIGQNVRLRRQRKGYGGVTYPGGTTFHIVCRHGRDVYGFELKGKTAIALRPEWIVLSAAWAEEEEENDRGCGRAEEGGGKYAQGPRSARRGRGS